MHVDKETISELWLVLEIVQRKKEIIMIRNIRALVVVLIASLFSVSCADMNYSKEQIGQVGGAAAGALLGYNIIGKGDGRYVGAALGGLAGYLAGKTIGKNMDEADKQRLVQATEQGLKKEPGSTYKDRWSNDNRTYETRVTSRNPYTRGSDWQHCKDFTQETSVIIDGKREIAQQSGTACYDSTKGGWVIQSQ